MSQFLEPTWNKPIKEYDIARDPLGMNRVGERMIGQLVQGFAVTTPRARYYSFYVWAIEQIREKKLAKNYIEFKNVFYDLERLFMLACIAHEEKDQGNHRNISGSETGRDVWEKDSNKIPLNFTYFGNRLGGYGQNYRGSIFNIGLTEQGEEDEFEKPTKIGYLVIENFSSLAKESKFLSHYSKPSITKKEILEIGEKLCLCKVKTQTNSERDTLVKLLFGLIGEKTKYSTSRQESLVSILNIINQVQDKKITASQDFLDAIYYGQIKNDGKSEQITIPAKLHEISKKWKIVKAHDNYALASEAILQVFLEFLQQDTIKGKNIDEFYNKCIVDIDNEIKQLLKVDKKFKTESIQNLIQIILKENNIYENLEVSEQSKQYDKIIKISSKINEHIFIENIEELVDLDSPDISKTIANSILLVIFTGFRFIGIINSDENSIKWLKRLEKQDTGVLKFTNFVSDQIKQNKSLEDFVHEFIQKFVILQAESVYKDKWHSNTANPKCWFHKEGANYVRDREYYATHRNIRFSSAISLLHDLDLLNKTEDSITCTKQGQKIFEKILQ